MDTDQIKELLAREDVEFRSMLEEYAHARKHVYEWEAKYRQEYEGKPPAYLSYRPM